MKIRLYDRLGYLVTDVEVPEPVRRIQIRGESAYMFNGGRFVEEPYNVIDETVPSGLPG